ncbi:MAG TPA: hypothetical protein VK760_00575, partial [Candidatus Acidoferrales bacterium]|nr:hypothetical protein [Candidatus Acidoferrales bacterium]
MLKTPSFPTGLPRGTILVWDGNDSNDLLTVVPSGDELFAPEPSGTTKPHVVNGVEVSNPVAPGVQVFNASNGVLDCTIASSSLPDPTVVTVSPYNGTVYVYDYQNQTINVFPYITNCTGAASLQLTPAMSFPAQFPVAGMTV